MARARSWLLPGGAIVLVAAIGVSLYPERAPSYDTLAAYGYVVLGLVTVLSWALRRSRALAAAVALAGVLLHAHLHAGTYQDAMQPIVTGLALPTAWLALCVLHDRPLASRRGVTSLLVIAVVAGVAAVGAHLRPAALAWLYHPLDLPGLPPSAGVQVLVAGAGAAPVAVVAVLRRGAVERALFWSLVAATLGSAGALDDPRSVVWILAAALILGAGVAEGSFALAFNDELTGLPGRRALSHALEGLGRTYTAAMVDVDHFKGFNDRHGHETGDQVLRMVAGRVRKVTGGGRGYRYGGEEFTVLFPGMTLAEAEPHLESLRRSIEESRFVVRGAGRWLRSSKARGRGGEREEPEALSVTVSIGMAEPKESGEETDAVLARADEALYRAKENGRNRLEGRGARDARR